MLHYFFAIILLTHSFIHLMAYAHELKLTDEDEVPVAHKGAFKGIEKIESVLWLVTYSIFICAVVLFLLYVPFWWMVAAAGVALSQTLIFLDWHEAKYGTISNLIVLLVIISFLLQ